MQHAVGQGDHPKHMWLSDPQQLGTVERYFLEIMDIPRLQQRIDCFIFTRQFAPNINRVGHGHASIFDSPMMIMLAELLASNFYHSSSRKQLRVVHVCKRWLCHEVTMCSEAMTGSVKVKLLPVAPKLRCTQGSGHALPLLPHSQNPESGSKVRILQEK